MITDEMLYAAAKRSCEVYLSHLERGYDPENQHEYPAAFERKIKKLQRRADHPVFYRSVQRAASLLLALLLAGGALLAVSPEARAAFVGWVKEVYETYFVYRLEGRGNTGITTPEYHLTYLPDGYAEFYADRSEDTASVIYSNEAGELLKLHYTQNSNQANWFVGVEGLTVEQITINGVSADLVTSAEPGTASAVMWIAEDNTAFHVSGFLSIEELIAVAESIQPK